MCHVSNFYNTIANLGIRLSGFATANAAAAARSRLENDECVKHIVII